MLFLLKNSCLLFLFHGYYFFFWFLKILWNFQAVLKIILARIFLSLLFLRNGSLLCWFDPTVSFFGIAMIFSVLAVLCVKALIQGLSATSLYQSFDTRLLPISKLWHTNAIKIYYISRMPREKIRFRKTSTQDWKYHGQPGKNNTPSLKATIGHERPLRTIENKKGLLSLETFFVLLAHFLFKF